MAVRDYVLHQVVQVSSIAQKLAKSVAQGRMSDLEGVLGTMRAAEKAAGPNRHYFAAIVGNVLCNLTNWPPEMADLVDWIGVPKLGSYFVAFGNGGFCRRLRDDPNTAEGNLPHHMLSYFVMSTFYQGDVITAGVLVHEADTFVTNKGRNPSGLADLRSGKLGAEMAQSMKFSWYNLMARPVSGFTDAYDARVRMGPCGHRECR